MGCWRSGSLKVSSLEGQGEVELEVESRLGFESESESEVVSVLVVGEMRRRGIACLDSAWEIGMEMHVWSSLCLLCRRLVVRVS